MWKKIVVIAGMLLLLALSYNLWQKTPSSEENSVPESQVVQKPIEEKLPNKIYSFTADNVTAACSEEKELYCAVENAVKCTIKPSLEGCKSLNLPKFIFMEDPSIERPTEINYRFTNKKVLLNNTTEIYTESTCNGHWFGLCQGNVIYVLAPAEGEQKWYVKDIYAIE